MLNENSLESPIDTPERMQPHSGDQNFDPGRRKIALMTRNGARIDSERYPGVKVRNTED